MKTFNNSLNEAAIEVRLSQFNGSGTNIPEATTCQNFMIVLVAILTTFALGSSPIVYAFINSPIDNQTTVETAIIGGNMF